jgi:hypothetical protein
MIDFQTLRKTAKQTPLSEKAQIQIKKMEADCLYQAKQGRTFVYCASAKGWEEVERYFLNQGCTFGVNECEQYIMHFPK